MREFSEITNKSTLILNLSLDGVGERHDEIRGVKDNFERLINTDERLTTLKEDFANLRLGVHTVVSIYDIDHLEEVYDFVWGLDPQPDSYL